MNDHLVARETGTYLLTDLHDRVLCELIGEGDGGEHVGTEIDNQNGNRLDAEGDLLIY
jgi:hypothetical protein